MHSQIIIQCRHTHIQCTMNSLEVTQLFVEGYMGGGGGGGGDNLTVLPCTQPSQLPFVCRRLGQLGSRLT